MKVFLTGADGFIGRHVAKELKKKHQVMESMYGRGDYALDLSDYKNVVAALQKTQPDAIIHCAGIVDKTEKARLNVVFTDNLLRAIREAGLSLQKIIICGSASEYGVVDSESPISEEHTRQPVGEYGVAKTAETDLALTSAQQEGSIVVVARIFNPIGVGMSPGLLVPSLIRQLEAIENGVGNELVLSRLDSKRDYIDVRDVASAFSALLDGNLQNAVYNIGRGKAVTNRELVEMLLREKKMPAELSIVETEQKAEPLVASCADISRIMEDTGWQPKYDLQNTIEEMTK